MLSRDGLVQQTYAAGLPRMAAGVALVWQFAALIQVLAYRNDFRQPVIPVLVWLGLLGAAAWLLPRARGSQLGRADAALAIAVAVAAVALVGWERRLHATGAVDWSVAGTGWLLALVALAAGLGMDHRGAAGVRHARRRRLPGARGDHARPGPARGHRIHAAGHPGRFRRAAPGHPRPGPGGGPARHPGQPDRGGAGRGHRDPAGPAPRLDVLEEEVLPLLRGIADGTADPADPAVQRRCGQRADALRRALADRAEPDGGLLAGLAPALNAAHDRGLPVEVQVIGDPGIPAPEVAGATQAAVSDVVGALPPHPVVLTVLASEDEVELYLTFEQPPPGPLDVAGLRRLVPATAGWQATMDIGDAGAGFLAVRWRKAA